MRAVDLFAGVGGLSCGAKAAGVEVVFAGDHWRPAVDAYALNHPEVAPSCQDLHQTDWRDVPAHDLLLAAPACQGHSPARGKERPHHDAQRSTAWAVVSAAEYHRPAVALVENVPAFSRWALYPAWCQAMHALGYALEPIVVDAADHGVPQHRQRLFVVATRSKHPISLKLRPQPHIPIASVVDWSAGSWSEIYRTGRAAKTLTRVADGRRRFGSRFVFAYYGATETGRSIDRPVGTITTRDRWALVEGDQMRMFTLEENKAAMSFPPEFRLPAHHKTALHLLGNAVPPKLGQAMVSAILEAV